MIEFINPIDELPYQILREKYYEAKSKEQEFIEALSVSSYSPKSKEVDSRYVNLKYIDGRDFIFFTNYNSPKSLQFSEHNQISALIFWSKTNTQIRMKAKIKKILKESSQEHFKNRQKEKNALAISSDQSQKISSYEDVIKNYNDVLKNEALDIKPSYWGGFSFKPYIFEFWEGRKNRLNKRVVFKKFNGNWERSFLQP